MKPLDTKSLYCNKKVLAPLVGGYINNFNFTKNKYC